MDTAISNIEDNITYETRLIEERGITYLAGVDEAGRGPLAGPVVVAAVIMPHDGFIEGVTDSKKLSEKRREELYEKIVERAVCYRVEFIDVDVIDDINILNATKLGMVKAIEGLETTPDLTVVDGNDIRLKTDAEIKYIVKGDAYSYTIGAASILAKVERDRLMRKYAKLYPDYAFDSNKGYGTAAHIAALREKGACPIHRKTFIGNFIDTDE